MRAYFCVGCDVMECWCGGGVGSAVEVASSAGWWR